MQAGKRMGEEGGVEVGRMIEKRKKGSGLSRETHMKNKRAVLASSIHLRPSAPSIQPAACAAAWMRGMHAVKEPPSCVWEISVE